MSNFDESKIKRDSGGKFATKEGGDSPAEIKRAGEILQSTRKKLAITIKAVADKYSEKQFVSVDLDSEIQKEMAKAKSQNERQKIAFHYIMDNLRGKYAAEDGRTIAIERVGADKFTHTGSQTKLIVAPELANLIQAGRFNREIKANHKIFDRFAYYDVDFEINGERYSGLLNVGIRKNGESSLYDLNPYNKK